jgi:hypothetical protein
MVFKSVRNSLSADASTSASGASACSVIKIIAHMSRAVRVGLSVKISRRLADIYDLAHVGSSPESVSSVVGSTTPRRIDTRRSAMTSSPRAGKPRSQMRDGLTLMRQD